MANTSYAKKKEESDKKIQAALEARSKRTSPASGSLSAKNEASNSKIQAALEARNTRVQSSLPDIFSDIQKNLTVEIDSYNNTKPAFGLYDDTYKSQRDRRLSISKLRSKVEAYRGYMDDGVPDRILSSLEQMEQGYDAYLSMSKFDSEEAYEKAVRESGYYQEYGNLGYEEIKDKLFVMPKGTEEYEWLSAYAPTVMKAEDYDKEISSVEGELTNLEAVLEEYNRLVKGVSTSNPNAYANTRLAELRKQYGSEKDIETKIEEIKATKWEYENRKKYSFLENNTDFQEKSTANPDEKGDPTYAYINDIDGTRASYYGRSLNVGNPYYKYDYMTDEEIARYNYLHAVDTKAADEYLEYLGYTLDERRTNNAKDTVAKTADEYPVFMSAISVPANLMSGIGLVDIAGQNAIKGIKETVTGEYAGPINYNSAAMGANTLTTKVRGTVSQNIANKYGVIEINEDKHPLWSKILNGKSFGDVYQLGMSMADSAAVAVLSPVLGSYGTVLLGGSAGTQGVLNAVANGATDEQALAMGVTSGIFEMLFEKYSLETLLTKNGKKFIDKALRQALAEGSEEFFTSAANNITEILVMAEKSGYIKPYLDAGLNEGEALHKALLDMGIDMGWDFVGGMFSGFIMGGASTPIMNGINTQVQYAETGKTINASDGGLDALKNLANEVAGVSTGKAQAGLQKQITAVDKKATNRRVGKLYNTVEQAVSAKNISTESIQKALAEKGMQQETAQKMAPIVSKRMSGKKMSRTETDLFQSLMKDSRVQEVVVDIIDGYEKTAQQTKSRLAEMRTGTAKTAPVAAETEKTSTTSTATPGNVNAIRGTTEATVTSSGKNISVKGFAEISGNTVKLATANRGTVDAKEVQYTDAKVGHMINTIAGLGVNAEQGNYLLRAYYSSGMDADTFEIVAAAGYEYGHAGISKRIMMNSTVMKNVHPTIAEVAYEIGQTNARDEARAQEARNQAATGAKKGYRKGTVHTDKVNVRTFNKTQKAAHKLLKTYAEATGIDIVLYQSKVGADGQFEGDSGFFRWSEDKIYIDVNAGLMNTEDAKQAAKYTMLRTFAHEFTHFIEKWNPVHYNEFRRAVFDELVRRGEKVEELIQQKQAQDIDGKMTFEEASREVVAEAMTDILPDASFVQTLAQKHTTVFRKLLEKLKEFTQSVKDYFGSIGENLSTEANALKEQVDGVVQYAESIVKLFDEVAVAAVENYQTAGQTQKNSAQEDRVQMQTRTVNGNEVVWIEDNILKENKGLPVHQFIADYIAEHIGEVYTIIESGQKVYIGEDLPGEYTQSKYTQAILRHNPNISRAKNRAVTNLGEMIEIATNRRWEKTKHIHSKDAKYGMYRYDTRLGFPVKDTKGTVVGANIFTAELLIRNASDGKKYLYDIVSIKKDTASSDWLKNKSASAAGKPAGQKNDVSSISISDDKQNVNKNSGDQHQRRTATLTNQDIISQMEGKTPFEKEKLQEYQEKLTEANAYAQELEKLNEQIDALDANDLQNRVKIKELKQESYKAKNRRDIKQAQLSRMENGVLAPLIAREKGQILERLQAEYGTIPSGEKAVRPDALPKSTDGENRVSYTARTVKGAGVTPDDFADLIDQEVVKGGLTYLRISNDEATQRAAEAIRKKGWEEAKYEWMAQVKAGKTGAEMVATGALLLNNAAKAGDKKAWLDILHDYQKLGTNSAQAVQAMRILKKLSADDSLYMAERSVEQMVEDMRLGSEIQIDAELKQAYLEAETPEERDQVMAEIQQNVADQIPSTFMDKWTALRYLNMLGNLRTQVRNLSGNTIMGLTVELKNLTAAAIENVVYLASGKRFQRSKAFNVSKSMLKAARADYREVEAIISDGGKYNDPKAASTAFSRSVMDKREIFKSKLFKWAEKYRTATNWAMDRGDVLFSKYAYARALAGYLKAHGVKTNDFSKVDIALMDEARLYAVQEAQEATFHDMNVVSKALSKRYRGDNKFAKVGNVALEGMMPFRKTPANIAVRAEEYSPLGLINSIYYSVQGMRKNSDITGAQIINSWAKTLTGSGMYLVGILLANAGILIGGPDDDDDLEEFQDLKGQQNYALKIGDTYITIDWASPTAIPLLMGAQFSKLLQEDGFQLKDIESALLSLTDPMVEMSMLQGINDVLENVKYSDSSLMQLAINAGISYLTQAATNTLLGQIERSFEKSRMSTYVDKNSNLPDWLQRTLGKASAKIPGWDYNQIPYINAWGDEEENPGVLANMAYNMLSPSYISKEKTDGVSKELERLHEINETNQSVFPSTPQKKVTFTDKDGVVHKDYNLSAEEYVALAKKQGQTQRQIIENMVKSNLYKKLPDQYKVKAVQAAYDYAREAAQIEVLDRDGFSSDWMAEINGDTATGIVEHIRKENIKGMFLVGDISASEAVDRYAEYFDKSKAEAAEKVAYWNFQNTYADYADWSQSAVTKYYDYAKPAGIDLKDYNTYLSRNEGLSKKDDLLKVIDGLPLTVKQKDALYYLNGWAESKLSEAPWHK